MSEEPGRRWHAHSTADSFRYALAGVLHGFTTQRNVRLHFLFGIAALVAGFIFRLSRTELAILVLTIAVVLVAEIFNTCVETVVDMITTEFSPAGKIAKDMAAGAVLITSGSAVVIGVLLFANIPSLPERFAAPAGATEAIQACAIGFLLLLFVIAIWKAWGGKGRFSHGGVVSGHAAIAFFLCTVIIILAPQPLVALLSIFMALLAAQSRVDAGVHSLREVLFGALLGIMLPILLLRLGPGLLAMFLRAPEAR